MTERDRLYLVHIIECLDRISNYLPGSKEELIGDVMRQDAIVRNLQVLAESTKRLSADVKELQPDIEWDAIAGFRNILVHDYLSVDLDEVWKVSNDDLSPLRLAVLQILEAKGWAGSEDEEGANS